MTMTNQEFIESIRLEGEEWREVVGYEERYIVSNIGRIASLSAPYLCGDRTCYRKQQLINPRKTGNYYSVVLSDGQRHRKSFVIHRIVATTFIPNPNNYPFINHKDENPANNETDNLEWCTQSYNCNYGGHNERMAKTIHETAYQRRNVVQLSNECLFINQYDSIEIASQSTGINRTSISMCCRKLRSHGGNYKWMYFDDYQSLIKQDVKEL